MKPRIPLFSEAATDLASAGGASVSASETPAAAAVEAPESAPAAAAEEKPKAPSLLERVFAATKDKAVLNAELTAAVQRAEAAESQLSITAGELALAREKITRLETERQQIAEALEKATAEQATVEAAAVTKVAEIGFDSANLPSAAKAGESREELLAELATCQDIKRRWSIAEKLNALN